MTVRDTPRYWRPALIDEEPPTLAAWLIVLCAFLALVGFLGWVRLFDEQNKVRALRGEIACYRGLGDGCPREARP